MRIAMLGGTRFIGRAAVEELVSFGHEVLVVHRGPDEPGDGFPELPHLHVDRGELASVADELARFAPDGFVDTCAATRVHADAALAALPEDVRLVVLSSADVYRAYSALLDGSATDAVPLDESSPLRSSRYPLRGRVAGADEYDKLDVEETYLGRGGVVLRLGMVYGERDYQRREWCVLRRVVAARPSIPVGGGAWLWSRAYVRDVARGIRLALESTVTGEVFNLAESRTWTVRQWVEQVADAAGAEIELVTVPDELLPEDLAITGATPQHLLVDASKARGVLGYADTDPREALRSSVRWHLSNPPEPAGGDFHEDDAALAAALA